MQARPSAHTRQMLKRLSQTSPSPTRTLQTAPRQPLASQKAFSRPTQSSWTVRQKLPSRPPPSALIHTEASASSEQASPPQHRASAPVHASKGPRHWRHVDVSAPRPVAHAAGTPATNEQSASRAQAPPGRTPPSTHTPSGPQLSSSPHCASDAASQASPTAPVTAQMPGVAGDGTVPDPPPSPSVGRHVHGVLGPPQEKERASVHASPRTSPNTQRPSISRTWSRGRVPHTSHSLVQRGPPGLGATSQVNKQRAVDGLPGDVPNEHRTMPARVPPDASRPPSDEHWPLTCGLHTPPSGTDLAAHEPSTQSRPAPKSHSRKSPHACPAPRPRT